MINQLLIKSTNLWVERRLRQGKKMPLTSVWEEVGSLGRGKVPTSERTEYKLRVLGGSASNKKIRV